MLAAAVAVLAPTAGAGRDGREALAVSLQPGAVLERLTSHAFATDARVFAAVTVDGRDLAYGASGRVVDFAGRGVIVRLVSDPARGPISVRMASVRSRPVNVRVEVRW